IWPIISIILGIYGSRGKSSRCLMAHNIMLIIGLVFSFLMVLGGFYCIAAPEAMIKQLRERGRSHAAIEDWKKMNIPITILMLLSSIHSGALIFFGFKARTELTQEITGGPQDGMSPYGAKPSYVNYQIGYTPGAPDQPSGSGSQRPV
ncbi:hypothetical protein PFISCL1PPCAC_1248, partial [Pristionchus fissidentatus]